MLTKSIANSIVALAIISLFSNSLAEFSQNLPGRVNFGYAENAGILNSRISQDDIDSLRLDSHAKYYLNINNVPILVVISSSGSGLENQEIRIYSTYRPREWTLSAYFHAFSSGAFPSVDTDSVVVRDRDGKLLATLSKNIFSSN